MTIDDAKHLLLKTNNAIKQNLNEIIDNNLELKTYMLTSFYWCKTYKEFAYCIKYNILEPIKCKYCNEYVKFNGKRYFDTCCSKQCVNKKIKQNNLDKYGYENVNQIPAIKEKSKQTCLEKYGVEFSFQSLDVIQKISDTKLHRYGCETYNNIDKAKQTCLEKYNCEFFQQTDIARKHLSEVNSSKDVKEKTKKTKLDRYGNENYINIEKQQQTFLDKYNSKVLFQSQYFKEKSVKTCLEKYGCSYYVQSDDFKEKSAKTCLEKYGVYSFSLSNEFINNYIQSEDFKEKSVKTCLEKYGCSYYVQSDDFKEKSIKTCLEKHGVNYVSQLDFVKEKINNTKRKNGTFNVSKIEDTCYELLKEKYPDVVRQYTDERYPFNCDFYIPSKDLFIECNFHWTHGGHSYNKDLDKEKLEKWQNKNTKFYNNAIYTWTNLDVRKQNIAKENNLNYIIFWNINDVIDYLS